VQELKQDPLGILRPASKLQHKLPLASAYAALAETPASRSDPPAVARQRRRCDPSFSEPKWAPVWPLMAFSLRSINKAAWGGPRLHSRQTAWFQARRVWNLWPTY
jgi:hypothetical protein